MDYETILVEVDGKVGLIKLNRPKALNALDSILLGELTSALEDFDHDDEIGAMLITGDERALQERTSKKCQENLRSTCLGASNFLPLGIGLKRSGSQLLPHSQAGV